MKHILFYSLVAVFITTSYDKKNSYDNIEGTERNKALADYKNMYLASETPTSDWTGNADNCSAGTNSADIQKRVLMRINYFRKICGLNYNITFDATKNQKCLNAALMMHSNNKLSHSPPSNWKCYTPEGKEAAERSNLSFGVVNSSAITDYIQDPGASNVSCGHRRWVLYSKAKTMGHGATSRSDALWVIGGDENTATTPDFIAYPAKGYFPATLVFDKWSLGVPKADFSNAKVEMKGAEGNITDINILSKTKKGSGDNTIIWKPLGIKTDSNEDIKYTVKVSNVIVSGEAKSYEYEVIIFNPDS